MLWHYVAGGLVAVVVGFGGGWTVREWKAGNDRLADVQADARDALRRADHVDAAGTGYETQRAAGQQRQRVITREVERVVQMPVYRDRECLDARGLQLVAEALGTADPASSPPAAVPAASGAR